MSRVQIQSRAHWHELRAPRIGASDVAALFDCGFITHFQLWHQKSGQLPVEDLSDNERVVIGKNLEYGIAIAASELYGYELRQADFYCIDDEQTGLGATLDFELIEDGKSFPTEIKNASWGSWRDNWITHEDGTVEAPLRYLLQVQAQLACTNAERGLLIALIAGDRIVRCPIVRHAGAIAEIRKRVAAFWQSIRDNEPPPAEMPRDLDAAKVVWPGGEGFADLSGDPDIEGWLQQLADLRADRRRVEDAIKGIEGTVLEYCVRNQFASVKAQRGRISCKQKEATPARAVQFKAQPAKIELRVTT
jgi:putative phage-type endonuclease